MGDIQNTQKKTYIMALDQGTTSSRCILFDKQGNITPWRSGPPSWEWRSRVWQSWVSRMTKLKPSASRTSVRRRSSGTKIPENRYTMPLYGSAAGLPI